MFREKLRKYGEPIGIVDPIPHAVRHTTATRYRDVCVDDGDKVTASKILGHSPSEFINRYCDHTTIEKSRDLLNKIGKNS